MRKKYTGFYCSLLGLDHYNSNNSVVKLMQTLLLIMDYIIFSLHTSLNIVKWVIPPILISFDNMMYIIIHKLEIHTSALLSNITMMVVQPFGLFAIVW